jgi:hypothetical protein
MFPLRPPVRPPRHRQLLARIPAGSRRSSLLGWLLRLGLLIVPSATALPSGVSAQALGTMQVTARVLPGRPGWTALAEVQALAREVILTPDVLPEARGTGLVQVRGNLDWIAGRRRLLVTVDYPRN